MKILILGDVMGASGRKAIKKNLSKIIKDNEIDFTVINEKTLQTLEKVLLNQ